MAEQDDRGAIFLARKEGHKEGLAEGHKEGHKMGLVEGRRVALFPLLARAGFALSHEDRARIAACNDASTLDRWCEGTLGAKTIAEVFS